MSTTNKTTLSENDIRSILINFLEGRILLVELKAKLRNYMFIDFDLSVGFRKIQNITIQTNIEIPVSSKHLRTMLQNYCDKLISFKDLSDWSAFIYMAPWYVPEGDDEEERWESGNTILWEIIQKLAQPSESGTLDITLAQKYIKQLI